jgi:hypothetical protein
MTIKKSAPEHKLPASVTHRNREDAPCFVELDRSLDKAIAEVDGIAKAQNKDTANEAATAPSGINDVCVDIETLGIKNNSVVLSIAVIGFDRSAVAKDLNLSILHDTQTRSLLSYYHCFHVPVSMLDCLAAGCQIDKGTAEFWRKQKDRRQLVTSMACEEPLVTTMLHLKDFLNFGYESIWAKSPSFDIAILRSLAESVGVDLCIDFRKERDIRTETHDYPQFDVREVSKRMVITDGDGEELSLHNPVWDAIVQLQAVQEVYAAKNVYKV